MFFSPLYFIVKFDKFDKFDKTWLNYFIRYFIDNLLALIEIRTEII